MRLPSLLLVLALSASAAIPGPVHAQEQPADECAQDCEELLSPEEQRAAVARYERRAVIFYVTGATLIAGGIAAMIAATAAWNGDLCGEGVEDCDDTAKQINAISAGAIFLGFLALVPGGLSSSAANRLRETAADESARLHIGIGASPAGAGVHLSGAF